jgi:hypothetical protein
MRCHVQGPGRKNSARENNLFIPHPLPVLYYRRRSVPSGRELTLPAPVAAGFKTGGEHATLRREYERLQASDESTLQAQKAEDALARVRPAVAQYLRLQLASEVLQRAIESYREKHQGPVLNRAPRSSIMFKRYRRAPLSFRGVKSSLCG